MGERRSAQTVHLTLRHQYGAGDYSAVMVIKAKLRCLPACGGVRVTDFITTWRISINQMEVAGFLPGIWHILAIFADGIPNNTVAFINLYDTIIASLNEPHKQSLLNIHQLFDRTIHIENNIQRNHILHPNPQQPLPNNPPSTPSTQPPPTSLLRLWIIRTDYWQSFVLFLSEPIRVLAKSLVYLMVWEQKE